MDSNNYNDYKFVDSVTERLIYEMAKRPMRIIEFETRLDRSDELLKDLMSAIEGNPKLGIKGAIPLLNEMAEKIETAMSDVSKVNRRLDSFEQSKGIIAIKTSTIFTRILQIIGAVGVIASIGVAVMQLIEWLQKQGLLSLLQAA